MEKSPEAISIYFHQKSLIIQKINFFKNIWCYICILWVKMHIGTKFDYCSIYRILVLKNRISNFLQKKDFGSKQNIIFLRNYLKLGSQTWLPLWGKKMEEENLRNSRNLHMSVFIVRRFLQVKLLFVYATFLLLVKTDKILHMVFNFLVHNIFLTLNFLNSVYQKS